MSGPDALWLLLAALLLDALVGDPDWMWRRVPHPVVLAGRLVGFLDRRLNDPALSAGRRRGHGVFALAVLATVAAATGSVMHGLFAALPFGWLLEIATVAVLLAQSSL